MPGNLSVESFSLQVGSGGTSTTFGSKSNASNVDPQTDFNLLWSESVSPGGEGCRLISIYELSANEASAAEPVLVKSYEGVDLLSGVGALSGSQLTIAQGSDLNLNAGLKDHTAYKLVLEEYIVLDVGGEGNARQVVAFTTGDFTEPQLLSSSPAAGDLAWPLSRGITLTFSEAVVANASGLHLRLKRVANSTVENVPCDGSASSSGLRLNIQGSQVQLEGLASVWYACSDFQLDADAGCLEDTSVNRNPSSAVPVLQFVTSCVTALSPANDSFQVAMDSQIVLTFSEAVQLSPGGIAYGASITLEPLGEAARQLGVDDYPFVYASGRDVTIDLACSSKRCKIFAEAAGLSVSTLGLCTGRALQNCRGKVHQVRVGPGAVLRASGAAWPGTSLLSSAGLNGTGAMAAQFVANPYTFTLRLADMTPPKMLLVDATAVSEATVAVKVQLDESGSVFCAAWGGTDGDSCNEDIVLLEQYSENGTCDTNRTTCTDCDPPSFGCFNRTVMWIDDGCQGKFSLKGYELECMSRELDTTIHDGAYKSVLSLGHRHACALQKHTVDTDASCWGKADYIEPVTGLPAAGSFSSISAGFQHTCAVRSVTGSIVCWGTNSFGETDGPAGGGVFWAVTSGYRFSCALYDDTRTVACWGQNGQGQATPPVGVAFLQISAGDGHVCGVRPSDYTAQCWGGNTDGQSTPPAGVAFLARSIGTSVLPHGSLSSGWHHTCGVRSLDGGVTCWGQNTDGQTNAPQDSTFVLVASGRAHSCGLEKAAAGATERKGTVRCWGLNDLGQSSPPLTLPKLSALSTGDDFTCGLALEDGEPFCWGKNDYLQSQPPFALRFGLPDEFITASCALETRPSSRRIRSASGKGDAAATVVTSYDSALGYAEANLLLGGLLEGKTYGVYCTAQDAELPTPNTVNEARVATAGRSVTMPDRTPPTLVVLDAVPSATQGGVLLLTLQLSEPLLKVFCTAVRDREPAPSGREIIASVTAASGFGQAVAGSLTLEVRLQYLAFDQEYDVYCTAQDPAGNWATEASVLRTKMDVHTLFDVTSPRLLSTVPVDGGYAVCAADGGTAGCVTTLRFLFDEDVQRGTGNFSLVCLSNIGYCEDVDVPVDLHTSATGSVTFLGQSLLVQFSQPLVDASQFKVVLSAGAVADLSGNPYALDSTCAAWLPAGAALTGACVDTFSFSTPS
ncbi:unnamed protein product [Polarella glacialis]|uniref:non-specific serine/threonine protein kinase n=2 Tax=Polarella glacialis TaxID=89957 RepID=A0A813JRN4_POLGL|nr:unnamed protein product [Polarella glacialis]